MRPYRPEEQDHPPLGEAGTRPSAPRDQRTASTYIFGAVCPKQGKGAALILPTCNTEAMNLHLVETPPPSRPAHTPYSWSTGRLAPVDGTGRATKHTIMALPPKCPELNPSKTSGSSCVTTGCRTASSNLTTISHHCCVLNKL